MRKFKLTVLLFGFISFAFFVKAQEPEMKYLFSGTEKIKVSGFIAPIMEYSAIGDEFAFFMGGGAAMMFNQTFYFGGYGEGLTTQHPTKITYKDETGSVTVSENISFGHGGFWAGYIYKSHAPIHAGVSSKFGWGSISPWDDDYKPNYSNEYSDHVFVMIPQVEAEFNLFKWMKLNVGVGYRFVTGIDKEYSGNGEPVFEKKDFNKPQATMTLMFGFFK